MKLLTPSQKAERWRAAVKQYQDAKDAEHALRTQISDILKQVQVVISAKARITQLEQDNQSRLAQRNTFNTELADQETRLLPPAREQLQRDQHALKEHLAQKPGLLANLFSLGQAHRT